MTFKIEFEAMSNEESDDFYDTLEDIANEVDGEIFDLGDNEYEFSAEDVTAETLVDRIRSRGWSSFTVTLEEVM